MNSDAVKMFLKSDERVDYFQREGLGIIQSPHFFNLSVDAVLLADFIRLPKGRFNYIDFCSGNGVIPLLLAHRTDQPLKGIEIQAPLVDMAQRSAQLNQLAQQVTFIQADLRTYKESKHTLYDIISCNPPYFLAENSKAIHQYNSHAIARHELTLTMNDWVKKARQMLKTKGKLFIVHRPDRLDDLMEHLLAHGFSVNRLRFAYPKLGRLANGVLIEAINQGGRQGVKVEPPLIVHTENDQYTEEMMAIYYGQD